MTQRTTLSGGGATVVPQAFPSVRARMYRAESQAVSRETRSLGMMGWYVACLSVTEHPRRQHNGAQAWESFCPAHIELADAGMYVVARAVHRVLMEREPCPLL